MQLKLLPPNRCIACGLKTKNMDSVGHIWVAINLPVRGIALFACSKCYSLYVNSNVLANVKIAKEEKDSKIKVVSDLSHVNKTFNTG